MALCAGASPFDFDDRCVRDAWSTLVPSAIVVSLCLAHVPLPVPVRKLLDIIFTPLKPFIRLHEAEAIDLATTSNPTNGVESSNGLEISLPIPIWRPIVLGFVATLECLCWLSAASYILITGPSDIWYGFAPLLTALTWLYAAVRIVVAPTATVPYGLFTLYVASLALAILRLVGDIFDYKAYGIPLPPPVVVAGLSLHLVAVLLSLSMILTMPMDLPSSHVKKEEIGKTLTPEDYVTLAQWMTFSWVYPLVKKGRNTTLKEEDAWELSPTLQSRPIFVKFFDIKTNSLLKRLFWANSMDMFLDMILSFVSVLFNYAGPFFLNRILTAVSGENVKPEDRALACVYAFLAFACSVLKAETDVQHLWFGRRASTRARSELMAAIYDKALKRKDFSGIVDKDKADEKKNPGVESNGSSSSAKSTDGKDDKKKAKGSTTADDPKAGAGIGKIVNLMAVDANRVSMIIAGCYWIYSAPLEIIVAATYLYKLMGWSAFAGFVVLIAGWPLNSLIAKRSIRIQKGVSAARDKRMGVLSELIGAIKFIKFFAWEGQWMKRALDAREYEMKWMIKARVNSVMFYMLWTTSPILVSVIAFFTFVASGHKLDVATAFTAITLFNMIRQPLNIIPTWIIQLLQTGVALKRIAVFLDEEEVGPQVSSLKRDLTPTEPTLDGEDEGLGLVNATLKWNEVEVPKDDKKAAENGGTTESTTNSDNANATPPSPTASTITTDLAVPLDHHFELRDISVMFPKGQLSVVTGPTASGKTALLMALLGEMTLLQGRLIMSKNPRKVDESGLMHAISYAAQSSWLRHQSIKDNILFGYPYDEKRYSDVVECCALRPDLDILEDGDATEIGAKGVSLSGGQKARVALARAVYARTKYVLLDDPLSAVDSHTSRVLYEKLLCGPLLKDRTVILVTHHVELVLPGAYYLVRMLDGRIDTQGTVADLKNQGALDDIFHEEAVEVHKEEMAAEIKVSEVDEANAVALEAVEPHKPRQLIKEEHREVGGVKWKIYKTYLKASSYYIWVFLAFVVLINQVLSVGEKIWVKYWGEAYGAPGADTYDHVYVSSGYHFQQENSDAHWLFGHIGKQLPMSSSSSFSVTSWPRIDWPDANARPMFYIGIYAAIGLASVLVNVGSVAAQYSGALRASRILFKRLLDTVIHATFRFHDTTPQGRMLNRFGKDIETIDTSLASSLQAVNSSLAGFIAAVVTIGIVLPGFLLPAVAIGFVYRELAVAYLNTGRDLRRMESNTRSPIFSDFNELLDGIVTVRAFSVEKRFLDNLHRKVDITTKFYYDFWMTNRWLLLNFDTLGAVAVLITTLFAISSVDAGWTAICITSAMSFTMSVYWACRFWTALELDLNSVERVVEYLDLPQEPPTIIENSRPPAYWPSSSSEALIQVENLTVRYSPELPAVINDVSFTLSPGERIGLLGRTGSGKSTLAMSLLRFVDPASGRILIDGIDITTIGVADLRSRLTFIPQDATLFSGTLRDNLDPFGEHDDNACREVLERVRMINHNSQSQSLASSRAPSIYESETPRTVDDASVVTEIDTKTTVSLDTQVSAGGSNFSQGQRQLIAMARALLRRSSIIILDEATSSIDFATDKKIQTTIREEFTESLLLTIAHRLRTVIDYDRLIVLDKGQIIEFDTPLNLIQKEGGLFRNMCLKSGTFNELEAAATAKSVSP
ncbi:hypothetical protein FISHEDRAFT_39032 [Fistulina hepatica ATCC 64428]|uniref:Multidrug resistance-associated ABC transporter n=1 Tax=Fistulina hepatica ATCC 64428 TaxID=1128425 RepID=A0A0D7AH24_9AGAR|nr:hypothetical protein FISHEDRAFT_39032 [Fistulina hepatica ATCC 64428]